MILPKWRWTARGFQTHSAPRLEEIRQSVHPDVKRLAAVWSGPGWYPAPVLAQVELEGVDKNGDEEFHITFWPRDPGMRAVGDAAYAEHPAVTE
jgi:hypothetical protein